MRSPAMLKSYIIIESTNTSNWPTIAEPIERNWIECAHGHQSQFRQSTNKQINNPSPPYPPYHNNNLNVNATSTSTTTSTLTWNATAAEMRDHLSCYCRCHSYVYRGWRQFIYCLSLWLCKIGTSGSILLYVSHRLYRVYTHPLDSPPRFAWSYVFQHLNGQWITFVEGGGVAERNKPHEMLRHYTGWAISLYTASDTEITAREIETEESRSDISGEMKITHWWELTDTDVQTSEKRGGGWGKRGKIPPRKRGTWRRMSHRHRKYRRPEKSRIEREQNRVCKIYLGGRGERWKPLLTDTDWHWCAEISS